MSRSVARDSGDQFSSAGIPNPPCSIDENCQFGILADALNILEMALKPLSEQISDYLIPWKQVDWPLAVQSFFDRQADLVLEVGFGDGAFLIDLATRFPERNYIGIELAWDPIQRLFKRMERQGLNNIRVLRCDAAFALSHVLDNNLFAEIFVNHPDPWPKDRHHRRRLLQREFIRDMACALVPGGQVTIATDHSGYAGWIAEILENQTELANTLPSTSVPSLPGRIVTRYQQKAREAGIGNDFFVWRRAIEDVPAKPQRRIEDMPNVALRGKVNLDDVFADFGPHNFQERHEGIDVLINLARVYRQHGEPHYLVEVMLKEGRFSQQLGINVLVLEDNKVTIKTSAIGFPRATWGVKRAVWHVSRLVLARAPQLRITNSTVGNLLD